MISGRYFRKADSLAAACRAAGFSVSATADGTVNLEPSIGAWEGVRSGSRWNFASLDEAAAFANGFATVALSATKIRVKRSSRERIR